MASTVVTYRSAGEVDSIRRACRLVARILRELAEVVRPGITTKEIDEYIGKRVLAERGQLLFQGYRGFPAGSCISVNEEVVHGIPSRRRRLAEGDVASVDVGVRLDGWCGDAAATYPVGAISPQAERLLRVCREALERGIGMVRPGRRLSGVSRAIQSHVERHGYSVVKKFVGHGIGEELHEPPQVPNFLDAGVLRSDVLLRPGLVLAIEPMVNEGTDDVEVLGDGWTVVTRDRGLSAHFEHTVVVTEEGAEILTKE
ncbi:MAG: type I methionyl aminopeptidase [Planctomycetes bacterium]|nr:type I methionyl aminopeptidase [Planctomycetota bacterium]